jgi:hypothetical protein
MRRGGSPPTSPSCRSYCSEGRCRTQEARCQQKPCALNAMAKERLPASHVVALAKNPLSESQLASVRNAMGRASAAATFVAVRAKSNHQSSKHTRGSTYAAARPPQRPRLARRGGPKSQPARAAPAHVLPWQRSYFPSGRPRLAPRPFFVRTACAGFSKGPLCRRS